MEKSNEFKEKNHEFNELRVNPKLKRLPGKQTNLYLNYIY